MKTNIHFILLIIFLLLICDIANSQDSTSNIDINFYDSLYSFIIDTSLLNSYSRDSDFNNTNYDSIIVNSGSLPEDIIFCQEMNKFFIYSGHFILIFDAQENQLIDQIDISLKSNYLLKKVRRPKDALNENKLVYNPTNQEIWCITNSGDLIVIDAVNHSVIIIDELFDSETLLNSIIKFDARTNRISLAYQFEDSFTIYRRYSSDPPYNKIGQDKSFPNNVRDFQLDEYLDILYIAHGDKFEKRTADGVTILNDYTFPYSTTAGDILYINNDQNNCKKVYCFPNRWATLPNIAVYFDLSTSTFIEFSIPGNYITSSLYNSQHNKVYFSYTFAAGPVEDETHLAILDGTNNSLIDDITLPSTFPSSYDNSYFMNNGVNNKILIGQSNNMIILNSQTNSYQIAKNHDRWIYYRGALNNNNNQFWAINLFGGFIDIFNEDGVFQENINIGGQVYHGCYNYLEDKCYLYGNNTTFDPIIYIIDINNGLTTTINFDDWGMPGFKGFISGIAYDENNNLVYVSAYNNSNEVKIIDGSTDQVIPNYFNIPTAYVTSIFISNNKLYCGTGYDEFRCYIFDLENNNQQLLNSYLIGYDPGIKYAYFETTNEEHVIFSSSSYSGNWGSVKVLDKNSNQIIETYSIPCPRIVSYSNHDNKIFTNSGNSDYLNRLYSIDRNNNGLISYIDILSEYDKILDHQYCELGNKLAVLSFHDDVNHPNTDLSYIECHEFAFESNTHLSSGISSIKYNPFNGLLYAFLPVSYYSGNQMRLFEIDYNNGITNEIDFSLSEIYREDTRFPLYRNDIVIDANHSKLIIPTGFHSNIQLIEYPPERITLKPETINWICFPRLERDNNDPVLAQPVLENIDPFPDHLSMTNLPPQTPVGGQEYIEYVEGISPYWFGNLTHIQSTRGYKLETSNTGLSVLPMEGTQLDPAYPMSLYEGYENWVGYYPTWQQDPFDALAEVLDELTLIKHHDWACVKEWGYFPPDGNLKPYWICCNKKPLKYADMVVLETTEDVTFQWGNGASGTNDDLLSTEYFSFDEKPDYTPIFIDLDSTDNPVEIGAFIADSCIGASVVEEGDTLVMIRGYMPEDTAGEVTFQEYYGATKSTSGFIGEYYVLNTERRIREKRIIHSGENKKYYRVSFSNDNSGVEMINPLILSVYPNPCQDHSRIDYFIPESSRVEFEIIDVFGRKVSETLTGDMAAGHYTMMLKEMNTNSLSPGIYLVRMSACGNTAINKILINR